MRAELAKVPVESIEAIRNAGALVAIDEPRHRWYFFKEAFSPEVVQSAIRDADCKLGDVIVDPFCGSGTVLLQAAIDRYPSAGVEVNPFLAFVAQAKLLQCSPAAIESASQDLIRAARRGRKSHLENYSTFTRTTGASKWLFNVPVLRAFEGGWQHVTDRKGQWVKLVRLCLIGAAMDTANAFKDGKCLRYRSGWEAESFDADSFCDALESRLSIVASDLRICPLDEPKAVVRRGDARRCVPRVDGSSRFKLCVTSPPYLNSFDYSDVYRPELFLGGWVDSTAALARIRLQTIRSHVQAAWKEPTTDDFGAHYAESIAALQRRKKGLWNKRIPKMVQAYFEDMHAVLKNLRRAARDDASMWVVVSTSAYAGIEIPVDLIIADIATRSGWFLRDVGVVRHLSRVSGQQWSKLGATQKAEPRLRESIVILDATPRA